MDGLQSEVRRLQQDITDASNAAEGRNAGDGRTADAARVASLQRELDEKQRELAKYQAWI